MADTFASVDNIEKPRSRFWPDEIVELARRKNREADLVVADWLEEHGCLRAAAVFRSAEHVFWRRVLVVMAEAAPDMPPRGQALDVLARAVQGASDQQRWLANAMPYGFDLTAFIDPPPPLPETDDSNA